MTPEFLLQICTMLVTGGAVYGAIRADIKALHARVDYLYKRIDDVPRCRDPQSA